LDAATGAVKWTFAADDTIGSSPVVVGKVVYLSTDGGDVYALNI